VSVSQEHASAQVSASDRSTPDCLPRPYPAKRIFDLVIVVTFAPVWLVALGVVAALVRRNFGAPVLFRQARPGRDGQIFELLKFRTMTDARAPDGSLLPDTERLTPFGRFLRSTSLDELPELVNVLRGQMSLVGPRPLLVRYLPLYSAEHRLRHAMPPGITGLAQVSGRNALTWPQRFDLDVRYARTNSLALDMRILWRTIVSVVRREGISAAGEATMPAFIGYGSEPASAHRETPR
jgi:lipopolysaccharide/colanic/teichoic acid biosynthesis glycosyltransferase